MQKSPLFTIDLDYDPIVFTDVFPIISTPDMQRALGFYRDQPWGERVARVLDPDGNEVIIGQHA